MKKKNIEQYFLEFWVFFYNLIANTNPLRVCLYLFLYLSFIPNHRPTSDQVCGYNEETSERLYAVIVKGAGLTGDIRTFIRD